MAFQRNRRDGAEPAIIEALEAHGCQVLQLQGGHGEPDLLVHYRGRWQPLEVKTPKPAYVQKRKRGHVRQNGPTARQAALRATVVIPVVSGADQAVSIILGRCA